MLVLTNTLFHLFAQVYYYAFFSRKSQIFVIELYYYPMALNCIIQIVLIMKII